MKIIIEVAIIWLAALALVLIFNAGAHQGERNAEEDLLGPVGLEKPKVYSQLDRESEWRSR